MSKRGGGCFYSLGGDLRSRAVAPMDVAGYSEDEVIIGTSQLRGGAANELYVLRVRSLRPAVREPGTADPSVRLSDDSTVTTRGRVVERVESFEHGAGEVWQIAPLPGSADTDGSSVVATIHQKVIQVPASPHQSEEHSSHSGGPTGTATVLQGATVWRLHRGEEPASPGPAGSLEKLCQVPKSSAMAAAGSPAVARDIQNVCWAPGAESTAFQDSELCVLDSLAVRVFRASRAGTNELDDPPVATIPLNNSIWEAGNGYFPLSRMAAWDPHRGNSFVAVVRGTALAGYDVRDSSTSGSSAASWLVPSAHEQETRCLAFNPNRVHALCTGGADGVVRFWDARRLDRPLPDFVCYGRHWINSVAFHPYYDQLLLVGGADGQVQLFNAVTVSSAAETTNAAAPISPPPVTPAATSSSPDTVLDGIRQRAGDQQQQTGFLVSANQGAGPRPLSGSPALQAELLSTRNSLISSYDDHPDHSACWAVWMGASSTSSFASLSYSGRLAVNQPKHCMSALKEKEI